MPMNSNMTSGRKTHLWAGIGVLVVLAIVVWRWTVADHTKAAAKTPAAIPVDVATSSLSDVPVYLTGLGTVQALNTVTMTARVDGQLQRIAFIEGQEVKKGDVLAQIDPRPYQAQLDQAKAKEAQDEAQLANAEADLKRYSALAAMDYTSQQTLDTTRSQVASLAAQLKSDQAAIRNAQTQLEYTTISSPIDGRTGIRLIDVGNNVRASDTTGIVVLTQTHPISVIFSLPEESLSAVAAAMKSGAVPIDVLNREDNNELDRGTVSLIDNQIDQSTGTIRLKAAFPNRNDTLWPGAYVNVRILLKTEKQVLTVPSSVVQRGPDGLYAYVLKSDSTVEMRPLKIEQDTGTLAVVQSGIEPGDRVVSDGQYRLKPGARVQAHFVSGEKTSSAAAENASRQNAAPTAN